VFGIQTALSDGFQKSDNAAIICGYRIYFIAEFLLLVGFGNLFHQRQFFFFVPGVPGGKTVCGDGIPDNSELHPIGNGIGKQV